MKSHDTSVEAGTNTTALQIGTKIRASAAVELVGLMNTV
jgi:hypothetical protein